MYPQLIAGAVLAALLVLCMWLVLLDRELLARERRQRKWAQYAREAREAGMSLERYLMMRNRKALGEVTQSMRAFADASRAAGTSMAEFAEWLYTQALAGL